VGSIIVAAIIAAAISTAAIVVIIIIVVVIAAAPTAPIAIIVAIIIVFRTANRRPGRSAGRNPDIAQNFASPWVHDDLTPPVLAGCNQLAATQKRSGNGDPAIPLVGKLLAHLIDEICMGWPRPTKDGGTC